jgi:hypothetical protein
LVRYRYFEHFGMKQLRQSKVNQAAAYTAAHRKEGGGYKGIEQMVK